MKGTCVYTAARGAGCSNCSTYEENMMLKLSFRSAATSTQLLLLRKPRQRLESITGEGGKKEGKGRRKKEVEQKYSAKIQG